MKPRVLVVDDEPAIRDTMRMILDYEGYETLLAASGEEGLTVIERDAPDMVFLDIKMPGLKGIMDQVRRAAPTTATVLLLGESGVGKELIARAIHRNSQRARERFVEVNCAAIPEELIESELFGHERGAFTGATEKQVGKFEMADRGTIFLDEVADMSP